MVFKYKREPDDTIWSGHPIPKFSFDKFNFLLPSLAELNLNIANIVKITYEKIIELEHFRETIILFLADELHEEDVFKEMTKNFIADFTKEETDYFNSLNEAYKTLTGTELKEWRVR
ncbi:MAG: hypothetical protein HOG49_07290 [Candidatus Scalindua sp.]|nr:hypothetical protein [Candidatus Scalindua sp.]